MLNSHLGGSAQFLMGTGVIEFPPLIHLEGSAQFSLGTGVVHVRGRKWELAQFMRESV